nr:probable sulfate transporter 3.4 [Tanacetum cinerariifolium]
MIYAVLGSSKHLAVGPVSIASMVMGTMLNDDVSYSSDPVLYLNLAFTATFFAGLSQASLGFLRKLKKKVRSMSVLSDTDAMNTEFKKMYAI